MPGDEAVAENRRPTTLEDMGQRMARMRSAEGLSLAQAFQPRPDDVIIATYPKSGTTWMQQIVHGLRTGGLMDFNESTAAVPRIEMAYDLGQDLDAEQAAAPRAFKSHLNGNDVQKGCRYIVVIRDPRDVAVVLPVPRRLVLRGRQYSTRPVSPRTFPGGQPQRALLAASRLLVAAAA